MTGFSGYSGMGGLFGGLGSGQTATEIVNRQQYAANQYIASMENTSIAEALRYMQASVGRAVTPIRKKFASFREELQAEIDEWLREDNPSR